MTVGRLHPLVLFVDDFALVSHDQTRDLGFFHVFVERDLPKSVGDGGERVGDLADSRFEVFAVLELDDGAHPTRDGGCLPELVQVEEAVPGDFGNVPSSSLEPLFVVLHLLGGEALLAEGAHLPRGVWRWSWLWDRRDGQMRARVQVGSCRCVGPNGSVRLVRRGHRRWRSLEDMEDKGRRS